MLPVLAQTDPAPPTKAPPAEGVYSPTPTNLPGQAGVAMHSFQDWALSLAIAFCMIGLLGGCAMLAAAALGHGSPQLSKVGWPIVGAALAASAASIISAAIAG